MAGNVIQWLRRTAARLPEKTAWQDETNSLTFGQAERLAMAVGTGLAPYVQPEQPVVVLSGRHVYTPVAFLGVVLAGGFYAPLDATMPADRLKQCLGVVNAAVMVVDREHQSMAEALGFTGRVLVLEELLETAPDEGALESAAQKVTDQSPLYMIFTSGSTGVPKGVITAQHSLMNYIRALAKVMDINEGDTLGCQAPLDYIAAVRDVYFPLYTGATDVILAKNLFAVPAKLFDALIEYKVNAICWSVSGLTIPANLKAFDHAVPPIKKVCFSGSVMPGKVLRVWQQNLPEALFINQYGPTEATASCTYHVVDHLVEEDEVLPIGKPFENYKIYLITQEGSYAKAGETGEICVAGSGVTLGYYNSPERTAAAFVQNPCNSLYREIIYRTGDLGKMDETGVLHFCGRLDRQIKHLGHRVELDELDAIIRNLDGVEDCFTVYYKPKELIFCFFTGAATARDMTIALRQRLPAFMVPRKYVQLEQLPKLPNGKINKQALQAMTEQ